MLVSISSMHELSICLLHTLQDIQILNDVVERVTISPSTASRIRESDWRENEDDDDGYDSDEDASDRYKRIAKEKATEWTKILCTWDCVWIWIRISEVLSFIVFDAFTEVFITVCIVVNIVFMALNEYSLECDDNDWTNKFHDGM